MIKAILKNNEVKRYATVQEYFKDSSYSSSDVDRLYIIPKKSEMKAASFCKSMMDTMRPYTENMKGYKEDFEIIDRLSLFENPEKSFIWIVRENGTHLEFFDPDNKDLNNNSLEWLKAISHHGDSSRKYYIWLPGNKDIREISENEALGFAESETEMSQAV